jgi:hypothetical protein
MGDKGVDNATKRGRQRVCQRKIRRLGHPRDVGLTAEVHGESPAHVAAAAAQEGRVDEHRIDAQRPGPILRRHLNPDLALTDEHIVCGDGLLGAVYLLIDFRGVLDHLTIRIVQDEVARRIDAQLGGEPAAHGRS